MSSAIPSPYATVSAWRNTSGQSTRKALFGLRLGFPLRDAWVEPGARKVTLHLEGGPTLALDLRDAFWHKCPEFKHAEIGGWLRAQKILLPWPKGEPPQFVVERIAAREFRIYRRNERG